MHRTRMARAAGDDATVLALAARDGDDLALVSLIETTQADVWRFCAHLTSRAEADDLTQETFVRAVRGLSRFRGESTVRTWLLSIARRVAADAVRSRTRRPELGRALDDDAAADPIGARRGPDPAEAIAIADLIDRLPEDRRVAFVLTQMLGYPYAHAAEICHCPVGTIRSRVARARVDLIRGLDVELAAASPQAGRGDDQQHHPERQ